MNLPPEWPAADVQSVPVADLVPYAQNARTHTDEQVEQIARSIEEWGWTIPILIDEAGMIIAGHGRVLAAQRIGIVDVPAMRAVGWSDEKKRAYVLADNKLTLNAGWDYGLLAEELQALTVDGFDASLTGFSEQEIANLINPVQVEDGVADDGPAEEADGGSKIRVGPYTVEVSSAAMREWLTLIRGECNDDEAEIKAMILRWLRLDD